MQTSAHPLAQVCRHGSGRGSVHRDAEAEGPERGGSLRRHHLRRVVRRPHLQSVLREVCACQEHRPKKQKRNQTEEDEVDMTGDIVQNVITISGSRCAHSNSLRKARAVRSWNARTESRLS